MAIVMSMAGCACQAEPTESPQPTIPAGWTTTMNGRADLRVSLPPWLVVFDSTAGIFANEAVGPGKQGLQLMAESPRSAEPQPRPGEDLERWLERRIGAPGQGSPTTYAIDLPTGPAVAMERIDRPGTPTAWRIAAYAIRTPSGFAFLMIDGPQSSWTDREDDVSLIARLLEVGP